MDFVLKNYYDCYRGKGLPPELEGLIPGKLLSDKTKIVSIRKPGFGFFMNNGEIWFGGALDDALELSDGSIIPLDNKTKGFPPKEAHWTHKTQMSSYTLILREKGLKTQNMAYLVYWFFDHKNIKAENPFGFNVAVEKVETNPDEIKEKILEAAAILKREDMPAPGRKSGENSDELCPFCAYRELAKS